MNYAKIGLEISIGWCLGKALSEFSKEFVSQLAKRYIPEKYWNLYHPENPLFGCINRPGGSVNTPNEIKIGFSSD